MVNTVFWIKIVLYNDKDTQNTETKKLKVSFLFPQVSEI